MPRSLILSATMTFIWLVWPRDEIFCARQTRSLLLVQGKVFVQKQDINGSYPRGALSNARPRIYTVDMFKSSVEEHGFAVEENVIEASVTNRLLQTLSESEATRSRAGIRNAMRNAEVARIASSEDLLCMAREILGPEAIPFRATLFDKSPVSNWLVVWHQDKALPMVERREISGWGPWSVKAGVTYAHAPASALSQVVALRLHLEDSVAENGPLRVLPGTHFLGILSDEEMLRLAGNTATVECLVRRGGVLAMRPLLVHASSKSRSPKPRRVLHIEYAAKRMIEDEMELAIA